MPTAVLNGIDVSSRIKAARVLRGITQDELARLLVDAGLSARSAGALERGELEMRPIHRAALCEALRVAEHWFIAPIDKLVGHTTEQPAVSIEQQLVEVLRRLDVIEQNTCGG